MVRLRLLGEGGVRERAIRGVLFRGVVIERAFVFGRVGVVFREKLTHLIMNAVSANLIILICTSPVKGSTLLSTIIYR